MGSLDDRSGFHKIALQAESWPLFGVHHDGVNYVCTLLPFGWNENPLCYHSLRKDEAAYLRSRGIPVLAYIDDTRHAHFASTLGGFDEVQWRAAAEALHIGILVSYICGSFLSDTKCDLNPSQQQRYLRPELVCKIFRGPNLSLSSNSFAVALVNVSIVHTA